jgi:2'-5' RNA ligase
MVMTAQLPLPGMSADPSALDRIFFALFPDLAAAQAARAIQGDLYRRYRLTGNPFQTDRLHVTLFNLGEFVGVPPALAREAMEAAASLKFSPFTVTFAHAASFAANSGKPPLVLLCDRGLDELKAFQAALGFALKKSGCDVGDAQFTPHITLLRAGQSIAAEPVEPVTWTVTEFRLIHSLLRQTRYIELGRWPLR